MELMRVNPDKPIFLSNVITSARYDFTACQLDIFFMLLAILEKNDDPDKTYRIHIRDIEAITGRQWQSKQLRDATGEMGSRMFVIETAENYQQLWIFQDVDFAKGKGYFDVTLTKKIRPYLFDLIDQFTVMQLKSLLMCSSKYAKRLYAIACQWRSRGEIAIPINELKKMLFLVDPDGKEKEQFPNVAHFKKKVLDIATEQINVHTDMKFDYNIFNKRGAHLKRNMDTIRLFIGPRKQAQTVIDFSETVEFQKELAFVMSYKISEVVARRIVKSSRMDVFKITVDEVLKTMKQHPGLIKDPTAYLIGALRKKGIDVSED